MRIPRRTFLQAHACTGATLCCLANRASLANPDGAEPNTTFGFDEDTLKNILVRIQLDDAAACGFIVNMEGKRYVMTCIQLISGHHRFSLTTEAGTPLKPMRIELSTDRDIVRIQVESDHGLDLAPGISDGEAVTLMDFPSTSTTHARLGGTTLNVKEERFDISATFGPEQCGSPILNANMQVCGIASDIDYFKNMGGSWERTARYFAYAVGGTSWFAPNWKQYDITYGRPLRDVDAFRRTVYGLASGWMKNLKSKIETDEDVGLELERWIKQHNGMVSKFSERPSKGGKDDLNKFIQKDFNDSCNTLVDICSNKSRTIGFISEQKNISPFLSNQFRWRSLELKQFVAFIEAFEKSKESARWV
jgi:hypothetical protein